MTDSEESPTLIIRGNIPPSKYTQAKEAARDGFGDLTELVNVLYSLPIVSHAQPVGGEDEWGDIAVVVNFKPSHSGHIDDVIDVMRLAGWHVSTISFERNRVRFKPDSDTDA